ncbi:hypothetical protein QBC46DRAFT_323394 [Diplogelasinospora grovesii]|uniref:Uncharacterized protein n=1 Tax=Diplogelasinospora grovesii TaxID=303347 RepID=A0AAN6S0D9_9PEZI|nr:hypothetical protein QBC46DRAFT_323394 [Diplogelasinospora grovesii]
MATRSHTEETTLLPHVDEDGILTIKAFEGAITTRVLPCPGDRSFCFEVIFLLDHPRLVGAPKPPMHFHQYQDEYLRVLEGPLVLEEDGVQHILTPESPEFTVKRGVHHRTYPCDPPPNGEEVPKVGRFLLSGQKSTEPFELDLTFFENWYAYQEKVVLHGERVDMIQVLSMFDAGGTYLSVPWWVPFRKAVARLLGVVVGRWIGGLLGYQPFYRQWTTDWELACQKMESCISQRRFAERRKAT